MGEPPDSTATTNMKAIALATIALVAAVHADSACRATATSATASYSTYAMWTTGVGSSACTAAGSNGCYVKGNCANGNSKYTITLYSDSACSTVATTSTTPALATCTTDAGTMYAGASVCTTATCETTISQKDSKATTTAQTIV